MTSRHIALGRPAAAIALILILGACSAGGGATAAPSAPAETTSPPADSPAASPGGGGGGTIGEPGGNNVVPQPGQLEVHPVAADELTAQVDGRNVTIGITWTSGVAPCNVLDHIVVEKGEGSYTITLFEGHGPGEQVCIMIAEQHRTSVELGELASGTYAIRDGMGNAAPIEVVIS
jgi:hypothetical protein